MIMRNKKKAWNSQETTTTPKAFQRLSKSSADLTATTMQASIQNADPIKVTVINSGVKPKTLIKPGALENPIVLKSSPWLLLVLVSPNNLTFILTPTTSICGTIQVVSRVLEVAIHKIHELN